MSTMSSFYTFLEPHIKRYETMKYKIHPFYVFVFWAGAYLICWNVMNIFIAFPMAFSLSSFAQMFSPLRSFPYHRYILNSLLPRSLVTLWSFTLLYFSFKNLAPPKIMYLWVESRDFSCSLLYTYPCLYWSTW